MTSKVEQFVDITSIMINLYEEKNKNYGDSFSKSYKEYGMTMPCIRLEDKLNRLKSLVRSNSNGTSDESVRDTVIDLACYAVMTIMELDNEA